MKKYIAFFSLMFCGASYSMEKNQAQEGNGFIVKDEYGSEIISWSCNLLKSQPVEPEKERVVKVKARMRFVPREVKLPSVANQRQKLLLEQAAKLRPRL